MRLSKVERIQRSVADYLCRREALRGVRVFTDRSSSLDDKFDEKLAPKFGLTVLVKRPNLSGATVSGGIISFGIAPCTIRVIENLLTNESGMSAPYVAEIILKSLIGFTAEGATSSWTPRANFPWYQLTGTTTTNVVEISVTTTVDL